jgi:hypothetical protein
MRSLAILLVATSSILASGQQTGPGPATPAPSVGWTRVRALATGSSLEVKLRHGSRKCAFRAADSDTLTCHQGSDVTLDRVDIRSIKVHHRGRSALVGALVGGGAGAIAGYAVGGGSGCQSTQTFCFNIVDGKTIAPLGGVGIGAIGAIIGVLSDFTSSTIYKAP